jgi:hypothetical protein
MELKQTFLRVLIASLLATASLAIGFLLFAEFDETTWKIIGTTAFVGGFSLLGLPGAALLDQGRAIVLGWATLVVAGAGLIWSLFLLWTEADTGWKLLAILIAFAGAGSQASTTTGRRRTDDPPSVGILYAAGLVGAVLVASMISLAAWQEIEDGGFYRVLGALAVADLLTVVLQPILRRTRGGPAPQPIRGEAYAFTCTLDARPAELPSWATPGSDREIRCRIHASDFASAVSTAISALEQTGGNVLRIERDA